MWSEENLLERLSQVSAELLSIKNALNELVGQVPALKDVQTGDGRQLMEMKEKMSLESGKAFRVVLQLENLQTFTVLLKRDATVKELKRKVQEATEKRLNGQRSFRKISWKHVWKRYWLVHGQTKLTDDRKRLSEFNISDLTELRYMKRLRRT